LSQRGCKERRRLAKIGGDPNPQIVLLRAYLTVHGKKESKKRRGDGLITLSGAVTAEICLGRRCEGAQKGESNLTVLSIGGKEGVKSL